MTDRPIIFSGPMVRALLDGRKTQTRRVLKDGPIGKWFVDPNPRGEGKAWVAPEGAPSIPIKLPIATGDRLWVRETWRPSISAADPWHVAVSYPHDGSVKDWGWSSDADFGDWKAPKAAATGNVSPLFMPRWASRLTLTVTDVRVQRLQDISEADAIAEGLEETKYPNMMGVRTWRDYTTGRGIFPNPRDSFRTLWNSLHDPDAWDTNPWIAAYTFTLERGNIDEVKA